MKKFLPASSKAHPRDLPTAPNLGKLPQLTDAGNADLFAALYKGTVFYDRRLRRWLIWKKDRWRVEDDNGMLQLAKEAAHSRFRLALRLKDDRERAEHCSWAGKSESFYRLRVTVELAKSHPFIRHESEEWDASSWLLGVANGVVDERTGKLRKERAEDRITLHSSVRYDENATCPRFEQFLAEVFENDRELIDFIRRAIGYSLTGITREQCAFLCFGTGANGKSTLLRLLHHVMGEYGYNLPFSAFELKARSSIPNDMAKLLGKRFVTASETQEGVKLNEQRVKAVTGEDRLTARFLFKEFFEFDPTHKIWLAFNHKPLIGDDSYSMWRRIRLIPFERQFADGQKDEHLFEKLKAETAGVLAWAVRGCLEWQEKGLGMPPAVATATQDYREESDHVGEFIDQCCSLNQQGSVSAAELWKCYEEWAKQSGETPLARNVLSQRLQARGLKKVRPGHDKVWRWLGICCTTDAGTQGFPEQAA